MYVQLHILYVHKIISRKRTLFEASFKFISKVQQMSVFLKIRMHTQNVETYARNLFFGFLINYYVFLLLNGAYAPRTQSEFLLSFRIVKLIMSAAFWIRVEGRSFSEEKIEITFGNFKLSGKKILDNDELYQWQKRLSNFFVCVFCAEKKNDKCVDLTGQCTFSKLFFSDSSFCVAYNTMNFAQ